MMQTILRAKFSDTPLEAALLESVARLWVEWLVRALPFSLLPRRSFHRVEARLWGVPRPDIDEFQRRLARRASQELPDASVALADPDTLAVTSPWRDVSEPAGLARIAGLFAGEEFEGMLLVLRLTAGEWRSTPDGRPLREGTLALWTELRGGVPRLKATWPGDPSGRGETPFHFTHWLHEARFWEAVDEFRRDGEAPACPERIFASPIRQSVRRASRWLQYDVGEQRTLGAFLVRLATFGAITAACIAALWFHRTLPVGLLAFPPGLLALSWFLRTLVKKVKYVAVLRRNLKRRLSEVYSRPLNFQQVNLAETGPWPEVSALKFSREAEHLGGVHWRDIHRPEKGELVSFVRIFAFPAQRMYLFLTLLHSTRMHRHYPVKAWFMSTTYFTDGTRLLLTNEHGGYGRARDPRAIQRFFPEAENGGQLLEMRRPVVERLIATGKEPAPLMPVDELLARMEADHLQIGESAQRTGYFTWSAAIRQSFHLTRREYRARL